VSFDPTAVDTVMPVNTRIIVGPQGRHTLVPATIDDFPTLYHRIVAEAVHTGSTARLRMVSGRVIIEWRPARAGETPGAVAE